MVVVGAGTMGAGIAQVAAQAELEVLLHVTACPRPGRGPRFCAVWSAIWRRAG